MTQVRATQVSQLDMFEMLPYSFIRVQIGCISWQLLQMDKLRPTIRQKRFDFVAAMNRRAIPHHQQLASNHASHMTQKRDALDARQRPPTSQRKKLTARRNPAHH